jgi:hypothetical protein
VTRQKLSHRQTAPGLADARTLKNDVINATLGQLVAHREARLTGAELSVSGPAL